MRSAWLLTCVALYKLIFRRESNLWEVQICTTIFTRPGCIILTCFSLGGSISWSPFSWFISTIPRMTRPGHVNSSDLVWFNNSFRHQYQKVRAISNLLLKRKSYLFDTRCFPYYFSIAAPRILNSMQKSNSESQLQRRNFSSIFLRKTARHANETRLRHMFTTYRNAISRPIKVSAPRALQVQYPPRSNSN